MALIVTVTKCQRNNTYSPKVYNIAPEKATIPKGNYWLGLIIFQNGYAQSWGVTWKCWLTVDVVDVTGRLKGTSPFFGNSLFWDSWLPGWTSLDVLNVTYSFFFAPWLSSNRRGLALLIAALGLFLGCHWAEWVWFCKSLGWLDSWIDI